MPIEELAHRTGVTVRNLRAMQARSLLAPPELVGRKGFYTERHEARVRLVLKMQSRGFSLASIEALLQSWEEGGGILDVMGLEDALMTKGTSSAGEADVEKAFPELLQNPRALAKAVEQGTIVERDGRYFAIDAELLEIVKQEVAAGFPLDVVIDDGDELLADLERIAARFRKSFFDHVVNPLLVENKPSTGLPDVAAKVATLRPLSVRLVTILFAHVVERGGGPIPGQVEAPEPKKHETKRPTKASRKRSR